MSQQMLDLNLIRILCALVETKNASEAAVRLDIGNSSVTYSLNKLREHYKDPIMLRSKSGMEPTTLALDLYTQFKSALEQIELAGQLPHSEPGKLNGRKVRIRTNSLLELALSSRLMHEEFDHEMLSFSFLNAIESKKKRLEALRRRQIDIDIGRLLDFDSSFITVPYHLHAGVIVCRKAHPRIGMSMTFEQLRQEKLLTWNRPQSNLEREMYHWVFPGSDKLDRSYRLASMLNILQLVAQSDAVTLLPLNLVNSVLHMLPLKTAVLVPEIQYETTIFAHIHQSKKDHPEINFILNLLGNMLR